MQFLSLTQSLHFHASVMWPKTFENYFLCCKIGLTCAILSLTQEGNNLSMVKSNKFITLEKRIVYELPLKQENSQWYYKPLCVAFPVPLWSDYNLQQVTLSVLYWLWKQEISSMKLNYLILFFILNIYLAWGSLELREILVNLLMTHHLGLKGQWSLPLSKGIQMVPLGGY